jgi:hypothetical protein
VPLKNWFTIEIDRLVPVTGPRFVGILEYPSPYPYLYIATDYENPMSVSIAASVSYYCILYIYCCPDCKTI